MPRFKTSPQKKFIGMLILFGFIPLFLVWYWIFFLDNRPGNDTIILLVAILLLASYFYTRYKKQIKQLAPKPVAGQEPLPEQDFEEAQEEPEEPLEEELEEEPETEEQPAQPVTKKAPKKS